MLIFLLDCLALYLFVLIFLTTACGSCQQLRWYDRTTILYMLWIFMRVLFLLSLCFSCSLIYNICLTQFHLYILNVHIFIFMCAYTYQLYYSASILNFIITCFRLFIFILLTSLVLLLDTICFIDLALLPIIIFIE